MDGEACMSKCRHRVADFFFAYLFFFVFMVLFLGVVDQQGRVLQALYVLSLALSFLSLRSQSILVLLWHAMVYHC